MKKKSWNKKISAVLASVMIFSSVPAISPACYAASAASPESTPKSTYQTRFTQMYNKIHDPKNGYFSPLGIPYHSVETLMCEAPDYGHETTSETFSYYLWLEAMEDSMTGNWSSFQKAWNLMEKYMIPSNENQPESVMSTYKPEKPATYAPEEPEPSDYPARLDFSAPVGRDPISDDLKNTYHTSTMYGMHWLLDTDNWYGFGLRGDGKTAPSFINTFQRGRQESCWETIPQPCWDDFRFGGRNGYLDLFTGDNSYSRQFKYTDAPDADARVVQATYDAALWSGNNGAAIRPNIANATKMGDYLRYAMFDKYFRKIGSPQTAGTGYDAAHYLLSWYYAWGGGISTNWSWKIGCSHAHFGYQNPMTAWILSKDPSFRPLSQNGATDWGKSLNRQLQMYQWLQSSEGAIAGGCSNSKDGQYNEWPAGTSTFYGMGYQQSPVYADPESNRWFGWQTWAMQRLAEYYYTTKDPTAKSILDKWLQWSEPLIRFSSDGSFTLPSNLKWSGAPDTWTGKPTGNPNLHVSVTAYATDLGVAGSFANTLLYYSAATNDAKSKALAKKLLDDIYSKYTDSKGVSAPETRSDYTRFNDPVYVPNGWSGTMPDGDKIQPGATFLSIRSKYKNDPDFPKIEAALKGGPLPTFNYHRFWSESEVAIAYGLYSKLFGASVTISPTEATFDHSQAKQADIKVTVTQDNDTKNSNGLNTLSGICNGTAALVKGQDYTVDENGNVDISKAYLAKQPVGDFSLTFRFSDGDEPVLKVRVIDSSKPAQDSTISPTTATFDRNTDKQADIPVKVTLNGNTLSGIYNGTQALVKDQDYTVDEDGNVTILKEYLAEQNKGTTVLTFRFSAGKDAALTVKVIDTTKQGSIKVKMFNRDTASAFNTISPHFDLVNTGKTPIDLSAVKIHYYYTADGTQPQDFWCDWSPVGSGNVTGTFHKLPNATDSADSYLEIGFTGASGNLAPGKNIEIQTRFNKDKWENYNQLNDYSFDQNDSSYVDWTKATGYVNGELEWGTEPSGSSNPKPGKSSSILPSSVSFDKANGADIPVTLTLNGNTFEGIKNGSQILGEKDFSVNGDTVVLSKAYLETLPVGTANLVFQFSAGDDAILSVSVADSSKPESGNIKVQTSNNNNADPTTGIQPRFRITNTGNSPIDLSRLTLRYYYTEDGTQDQRFWCDWSQVGGNNVTGTFHRLSDATGNADSYLEIGFRSAAGTLAPGASIDVQARFSKADWSNYNQANDYSFNSQSNYSDWNKVTAYLDGNRIWGTEPAALSKALSALAFQLAASL